MSTAPVTVTIHVDLSGYRAAWRASELRVRHITLPRRAARQRTRRHVMRPRLHVRGRRSA